MRQISGNLLDFPEGITVLCHQANCQATMGSGIAAQIRERYPEAALADRDAWKAKEAKLGLFSSVKINDTKTIVNLYGQYDFKRGRDTDYEGLYLAMDRLFGVISEAKDPSKYVIGIPFGMGCGLGGGDWRIVSAMIEVLEEKYHVPVVIVKYENNP